MKTKLCIPLIFLMFSCAASKGISQKLNQGVSGTVTYVSGNQMPSPDRPARKIAKGIMRWLYIYERTAGNQVSGDAPMYTQVRSKLISRVQSDSIGHFQCRLNPGNYSMFVAEENKFFANRVDNEGYIAVFEVEAGKVTVYDVLVNNKALY